MTFLGLAGTIVYLSSVVMIVYAIAMLSWSTLNAADVDIPGIGLTSANFRLGLFAMRAQIKQAGLLPFATQCYSWCDEEAMQPGPFSGDHDRAYCTLLRTAQLGAVTSAALGFTAFLSMLALSTNLIRYATRRHVSAFSASIVLLQALTGLQTIVAWACIRKIANSDLRESFGPGFVLDYSIAWFLTVAAVFVALVSFGLLAFYTPAESRKISLMDMDEEGCRMRGSRVAPTEDVGEGEPAAKVASPISARTCGEE